jgi:hypothetical protein
MKEGMSDETKNRGSLYPSVDARASKWSHTSGQPGVDTVAWMELTPFLLQKSNSRPYLEGGGAGGGGGKFASGGPGQWP